jgi:hypothetical protein
LGPFEPNFAKNGNFGYFHRLWAQNLQFSPFFSTFGQVLAMTKKDGPLGHPTQAFGRGILLF